MQWALAPISTTICPCTRGRQTLGPSWFAEHWVKSAAMLLPLLAAPPQRADRFQGRAWAKTLGISSPNLKLRHSLIPLQAYPFCSLK